MKMHCRFVILQERAEGNGEVGEMWIDTHTFPPSATLAEVWERVANGLGYASGRTMIRPDQSADLEEYETKFPG